MVVKNFEKVSSFPVLLKKLRTQNASNHFKSLISQLLLAFKVEKTLITAGDLFKEDLNLDSLDTVELVMAIEDEFVIEIPDSEADKFFRISDVTDFIANHPMAK